MAKELVLENGVWKLKAATPADSGGIKLSRKYVTFANCAKSPEKIVDSGITIGRPNSNWFSNDFVLGNSSLFVDNIVTGSSDPSASGAISELLTTSNNLNFGYEDDFSCSFWLKCSYTNDNNGLVGTWSGDSSSSTDAKGFLFYINSGENGRPRFIFGTDSSIGGYFRVKVDSELDDNTWKHVCLTWEGTTNTITSLNYDTYLKVYYDGSSQPLTDFDVGLSGTSTSPSFAANDLKFQVGTYRWKENYPNLNYSTNSRRFDEMGIWSKTLSASEVSALYNSGNGVFCNTVASSDLITRYSFDIESTDNNYKILDKIGNNHLEIVLP